MPDGQAFTLALVLTAGGAAATAAVIAGVIALLKNLPGLGTWIDAGREVLVTYVAAAVLVILAAIDTHVSGLEGGFGCFLAWYGICLIASKAHDVASESGLPIIGKAA